MLKLFTDGGARGNPGIAASGFFLFKNTSELVDYGGDLLGTQTNNYAEYRALISGLKLAIKHNADKLECFLDSELIVKQLNGEYKVKNKSIKPLYEAAKQLTTNFSEIKFTHIYREKNKFADKMVNVILDSISKNE